MKPLILAAALLSAGLAMPMPALADNPLDPEMQTLEARERDRALIRALNLDMLAIVTERDKRYAKGWHEFELAQKGIHPDQLAYNARLAEYQSQLAQFEASRALHADNQRQYQLAMDAWRHDVSACRDGNRAACAGD